MNDLNKRPVIKVKFGDTHSRFVMIRACIRAAVNSKWPRDKIQQFCTETIGAIGHEEMMNIINDRFEVVYEDR